MKTNFLNLRFTGLLLVILLASAFYSCEKERSSTYRGRILSYGTLDPVADAMVYIIAGNGVGLFEPVQEWVMDSVKTDAEGRFRILATEGDYHRIGKIRKEGYYPDLPGQVTSLLTVGPQSNRDYIIDPIGVLHVAIENDPNVEGDYISINLPGRGSYIGVFNTFYENYLIRSSRSQTFYYQIGVKPSVKDSIFCVAFDTTFLHIKF